ncbi:unnamed protein product, partial [Staurois parvus]
PPPPPLTSPLHIIGVRGRNSAPSLVPVWGNSAPSLVSVREE